MLRRDCTISDFLASDEPIRGFEAREAPHGERAGRFLPFEVLHRDLQAGVFAQGGAMVQTSVGDKAVSPLRARSVALSLGANLIQDVDGPYAMPVISGDITPTWLAEIGSASEADFAVMQALASPHRLTVTVKYSKLLPAQSRLDFDAMLADQVL